MTATTGEETAAPLALALDARWIVPERAAGAAFRLALATALAVHMLLGVALTGGLDFVAAAIFGEPPRSERRIGDKSGEIDGIAAEVIDAAEFNKRFIAYKAGSGEIDSEAAPQQPAQKAEPETAPLEKAATEKPQDEVVAALKPADGWAEATPKPEKKIEKPEEKPVEKAREAPREPPAMTDAEMRELVTQSIEDLQSSLVSVSAPGAARLGEASPFVKGVIRTLKANMPKPPGLKGTVVIQLIVGSDGRIEGIRVVKGSGRPELDRFVADRVFKTRLAAPPANASLRERHFQISYEYK